jgi:hypothetical protein
MVGPAYTIGTVMLNKIARFVYKPSLQMRKVIRGFTFETLHWCTSSSVRVMSKVVNYSGTDGFTLMASCANYCAASYGLGGVVGAKWRSRTGNFSDNGNTPG